MGPKSLKVELTDSQQKVQKLCYDEGYKFGRGEPIEGFNPFASADMERLIEKENPYRKKYPKSFMDKAWGKGAFTGMSEKIKEAKDAARALADADAAQNALNEQKAKEAVEAAGILSDLSNVTAPVDSVPATA